MMLKMIIADDELKTLEGISDCLNWSDYGIEIAGFARNGLQAAELVRECNPDILLTDIKMPKMDGIQLSMNIRAEFPDLKIIFITGHADLGYIKSAFKCDVIDYILKPVDPEELAAVVRKAAETCRLEKNAAKSRVSLENKIRQSMPLLQENFFRLLISGELANNGDILQRMEFLDVDLPVSGIYLVMLLDIDDYYLLARNYSIHDKQLLSFSTTNIAAEVINSHARGIAFEYNESEFLCIICFPAAVDDSLIETAIGSIAVELKNHLNNILQISVTVGIGEKVGQIGEIALSYQRARFAVQQKLLVGKNSIIYGDLAKQESGSEMPLNARESESLYIALRLGSFARVSQAVNQIFEKFERMQNPDKPYIRMICLQLLSVANRVMTEFSAGAADEQLNIYHLVDNLLKLETLADLKSFILATCQTICDKISKMQHVSSKKAIDEIKAIIGRKYSEDISINSIAADVFLTPSYICLLFKQETGETINSYLTRYRIEKAKELISGKTVRLYEVSRLVGYNDPKHFSKLFKKYTGFNPSDYK